MATKKKSKHPSKLELITLLKECRDLIVLCSLIDRSGQCKALSQKIDDKMGWR